MAATPMNRCWARCTGNGLGATGRCRAGYACRDADTTPNNGDNYCQVLCISDTECAGSDGGYGCNPASTRCEGKNLGLPRYGAACTSSSQCETGLCATGSTFPGGYCAGDCRGDLNNCGTGGYCQWHPGEGDNVGLCTQACSTTGMVCRTAPGPVDYSCVNDTYGTQMGRLCMCKFSGQACNADRDCCTGSCGFFAAGVCDL